MKQEIFKTVKNWLLTWVIALTVVCAGFYVFIKARSSTNPGLTDPNSSALYANAGETLTASKRNVLINKVDNDVIYCQKSWTLSTLSVWSQFTNFTASDCWGTLPDSNYVWVINYLNIAGWPYLASFNVVSSAWSSCTWPCARFYHGSWGTGSYWIWVIYVKQ